MYALLFPVLAPFVLLAMLMGLSWLEDRLVPPAAPEASAAELLRLPSSPPRAWAPNPVVTPSR